MTTWAFVYDRDASNIDQLMVWLFSQPSTEPKVVARTGTLEGHLPSWWDDYWIRKNRGKAFTRRSRANPHQSGGSHSRKSVMQKLELRRPVKPLYLSEGMMLG